MLGLGDQGRASIMALAMLPCLAYDKHPIATISNQIVYHVRGCLEPDVTVVYLLGRYDSVQMGVSGEVGSGKR